MNLVGKPNYPEDELVIDGTISPHFATPAGLHSTSYSIHDAIMLFPLGSQIDDACNVELRERSGDS